MWRRIAYDVELNSVLSIVFRGCARLNINADPIVPLKGVLGLLSRAVMRACSFLMLVSFFMFRYI